MTLTDKARAGFASITKWKGQAASYSPQLGSLTVGVSGAALAAALAFTPSAAMAGDCDETTAGSGVFECSGAADPATDVTQVITAAGPLTVTTEPGFGITVGAGDALFIRGQDGTSFTDTNAAQISGGNGGVYIRNDEGGPLSVSSNGTISSVVGGSGVVAVGNGVGYLGDNSVALSLNNTSGVLHGVAASNFGEGALTITSVGTANGGAGDGIHAYSSFSGYGLTITSAVAIGGNDGIDAFHEGTGDLVITSASATGTSRHGVRAYGASGTLGSIVINAIDSTGGINGILGEQRGSGAVHIRSTGAAMGGSGAGILATVALFGGDIVITAVDSTGGTHGIDAQQNDLFGVNITSTGTATTSGLYFGIRAENQGTGMLTIGSVEDEDGNRIGTARGTTDSGVFAVNEASGIGITIAVNDAIAGLEQPDGSFTGGIAGINAVNRGTAMVPEGSAATNGLTIAANNTTGGQYGIRARNEGTGALTITSTGNAIGASNEGILAQNFGSGTDLTVNANNTSGGNNGIYARNGGSGALTITSTGTATGTATATNGVGIRAFHYSAEDFSITAEDTIGNFGGIRGTNFGTGTLTITSNGTATATGTQLGIGSAIYASTLAGDIVITANHTRGVSQGILARSYGRNLTITSNGDAVATSSNGIALRHGGTGDAVISANNTSGPVTESRRRTTGKARSRSRRSEPPRAPLVTASMLRMRRTRAPWKACRTTR